MKLRELNKVMRREFKRIAERKTLYLYMIFLPAILFFFYAAIYSNEILRELPVVIYDADHSPLSEKIIQLVEASPSMKIAAYVNSLDEIKSEMRKGKIHGAFYIPKNMEKDIKSGKNSSVVVYKNTANLIIGNTILKDATTIVRTASGGMLLKKLEAKGLQKEKAMNIVNPIRIESQSLFNPNYSYESFLMPGLCTFTLQMMIMIAAVVVISSEFTHGTFNELLQITKSLPTILLGKSLPHFLIQAVNSLFILGIVFIMFNVRVSGSFITIYLFMLLFALSCLMLGLLISSIFHDQLFATELAIFINTPAFIFSGFTFPLWGMPFIHTVFAQIMPFTHFLSGFLKLYQMNAPISAALPEIKILSMFAIVPSVLTLIVLHFQAKIYSRKNPSNVLLKND